MVVGVFKCDDVVIAVVDVAIKFLQHSENTCLL